MKTPRQEFFRFPRNFMRFFQPAYILADMSQTDQIAPLDFDFVEMPSCVALYDDLASAPRITQIAPAATNDYIESLATTIYEQAKLAGGNIPYSVIREVSENFIHAQFHEIVVSILDNGNTIRFADQGPGIHQKEKAVQPGFSSATQPMKAYIRGVGSGLPIVKDYLDGRNGSIVIEDNLISGAVVTISLVKTTQPEVHESIAEEYQVPKEFVPRIPLSDREREVIKLLLREGDMGVTEIHNLTGLAVSSVHNVLRKLEEAGFLEKSYGKKRTLTAIGQSIASSL